jgi:hypothetical protein
VGDVVHARKVHRNDALPVVGADVLERLPRAGPARVVHEDVHGAELVEGRLRERPDRVAVGDVALDREYRPREVGPVQFVGDGLDIRSGARTHDDVGTVGDERLGDGAADAAGGAGDDCPRAGDTRSVANRIRLRYPVSN